MTDFNDVTRNFTDGLNQITKYTPGFVTSLQSADKTFRQRKDTLVRDDGSHISFAGQGANAFGTCVENNIARTQPFQDHWNTLAENTSNLLSQFNYSNDTANTALNNPPLGDLGGWVAAEKPYSSPKGGVYTKEEAWNEMREAALKGCDMNTVMNSYQGQAYFLRQLDYAQQDILSDITTQHNRRVSQFKDPNSKEAEAEAQNYKDAQTDLQGLHDLLSRAITTWFHDMMPMIYDYGQGIQNNKVTVPQYVPLGTYTSHTSPVHILGTTAQQTIYSGWTKWNPSNGSVKYVIGGGQEVWGNKQKGFTLGGEVDGPSVNLQAGNVSAVSGTVNAGFNIGGGNIGVNVTAGAIAGAGLTFKDGIQFSMPFLSGGLTWGPAK